MLIHNVYFWLTDDISTDQRHMFKEKLTALKNITAAEAVYVGTPAGTDRPVVDRSYDYALTVVFKDIEAHDRYQEDPLHKDFLTNCSAMFEQVIIYDAD
jgi:hypothetical protein